MTDRCDLLLLDLVLRQCFVSLYTIRLRCQSHTQLINSQNTSDNPHSRKTQNWAPGRENMPNSLVGQSDVLCNNLTLRQGEFRSIQKWVGHGNNCFGMLARAGLLFPFSALIATSVSLHRTIIYQPQAFCSGLSQVVYSILYDHQNGRISHVYITLPGIHFRG